MSHFDSPAKTKLRLLDDSTFRPWRRWSRAVAILSSNRRTTAFLTSILCPATYTDNDGLASTAIGSNDELGAGTGATTDCRRFRNRLRDRWACRELHPGVAANASGVGLSSSLEQCR